jgi:hypothetical protein
MRLPSFALIAVLFGIESVAFAQGKPDPYDETPKQDPATAMAAEGKALLDAGKLDEACAKLAESARLAEKSATLLDLATCRDKQGKKAQAYRVLERAGTVAQKEKQPKNTLAAVSRQKALEKSLAFVTIAAPREPMRVTIDGVELSPADFGKAFAIDLGERTVAASADGKKRWEQKINATVGQRTNVEIPPLETETAPVAPPVAPEPHSGAVTVAPAPAPPEPKPPIDEEREGRLVIEGGFVGGFQFSYVPRAPSSTLDGLAYKFPTGAGTNLIAACGDDKLIPGSGDCTGEFRSRSSGAVGGQLFIGYSISKRLHLGGRAIGAALLPRGEVVAGGPSLSIRANTDLWIGLSAMVGFERHRALLLSARGSVPEERVAANGSPFADVPLGTQYGATPTIFSSILAGAQIEIAWAVLGVSAPGYKKVQAPSKLATGSLMLGAWPMIMGGPRGLSLTVPVGFGYRFY